jgi:glutamate formiminotransferase/formiminotetrahydrofolate cyclodeaminase
VYLTTNDVRIAQKIARAVRNSSGGMRYVKAMGVLVEGLAQVSMNLTNFRSSPIFRVVELVRREAQHFGVNIHHTELVGLTPQAALINSAIWYLQTYDFQPEQLLEQRLYAVMREQQESGGTQEPNFLDRLASGDATPGGGSAAAYTGAEAAALVAMVGRLTVGKKKYEAVKDQMWALIEEAEGLRKCLTEAVAADSQAFEQVMAAFKLPKETDEQQQARGSAIQQATLHAAEVPLQAAKHCLRVMELAQQAVSVGNTNAITDGGTGATLARAALTSACYNVRTNVLSLDDGAVGEKLLQQVRELESQSDAIYSQVRLLLKDRGGLSLS